MHTPPSAGFLGCPRSRLGLSSPFWPMPHGRRGPRTTTLGSLFVLPLGRPRLRRTRGDAVSTFDNCGVLDNGYGKMDCGGNSVESRVEVVPAGSRSDVHKQRQTELMNQFTYWARWHSLWQGSQMFI